MTTYRIGQYIKEVNGKKAILTQEIKFYDKIVLDSKYLKVFPPGTEITALHEVYGTGLTTFKFTLGNKEYEHPVREGKFKYL